MAALRVENLRKTFRDHRVDVDAVANLCLDVADGEFVVLVGPSGCGKSTTLRMIAGLEAPTAGKIILGGRDVTHRAPADRDVAVVFQNYALYPHMSAFENMAFGLKLRKLPKHEITQQVHDAASWLRISYLLDRRPASLSGGEQQRVALGRAVVRRPQLFLFDEPLANFDAALRLATRAELKRLQREFRTTTVHVTHDQEEAMALADRVVVLRSGRVQQVAAPQEIYDRPANRFVAGFFGAPPMQFIDGTLRGGGAEIQVETPLGRWSLSVKVPASFREHLDQSVTIGFAAQAIEFTAGNPGGTMDKEANNQSILAVPVAVEFVESMGHSVHIGLRTETGLPFVCRESAPHRAVAGMKGSMRLCTAKAHLFVKSACGKRLN